MPPSRLIGLQISTICSQSSWDPSTDRPTGWLADWPFEWHLRIGCLDIATWNIHVNFFAFLPLDSSFIMSIGAETVQKFFYLLSSSGSSLGFGGLQSSG